LVDGSACPSAVEPLRARRVPCADWHLATLSALSKASDPLWALREWGLVIAVGRERWASIDLRERSVLS